MSQKAKHSSFHMLGDSSMGESVDRASGGRALNVEMVHSDSPTPMQERNGTIGGHTTSYRPDVDGLRTVAVVAVILFHFDSSLMPGVGRSNIPNPRIARTAQQTGMHACACVPSSHMRRFSGAIC